MATAPGNSTDSNTAVQQESYKYTCPYICSLNYLHIKAAPHNGISSTARGNASALDLESKQKQRGTIVYKGEAICVWVHVQGYVCEMWYLVCSFICFGWLPYFSNTASWHHESLSVKVAEMSNPRHSRCFFQAPMSHGRGISAAILSGADLFQ